MENSQNNVHAESLDFCRICLFKPEFDRTIKIINIFPLTSCDLDLSQTIKELLGITIVEEDIKPKIICENCHNSLLRWVAMKKKAIETEILIDRIIKKVGSQGIKSGPVDSTNLDLPHCIDNNGQLHSSSSKKNNSNLPNVHQITSEIQKNCFLTDNRGITRETDDACAISLIHDLSDNQITIKSESDNEELVIDEKEPPARSVTDNLSVSYNDTKDNKETTKIDVMSKPNLCTSSLTLFTCLKPYCNHIYQSFKRFQNHYRKHFEIEDHLVMCWQCFTQYPDQINFSNHIQQGNCQKIGMCECFECGAKYNDLQSLSVHKIIVHNCTFAVKNTKKLTCPFCKNNFDLSECKTHLIECQKKYYKIDDSLKIQPPRIFVFTPKLSNYLCTYCKSLWSSRDSLEKHFDDCPKYEEEKLNNITKQITTNNLCENI